MDNFGCVACCFGEFENFGREFRDGIVKREYWLTGSMGRLLLGARYRFRSIGYRMMEWVDWLLDQGRLGPRRVTEKLELRSISGSSSLSTTDHTISPL